MSKKRYCEEKGINEAIFYYWFSHSKENGACSGGFIAIAIDNAVKKCEVEVVYPNRVRIKADTDLGLLSQLIRLY
ncbi:IS66 family insertion sequence element accessory protein TnpA [Sphingobacterium thalpophilum]|uniref:IS66 family insertion sequence element accessory protein TnpA n=1 Tax=Sphingobacterium thalpophilum TaxID=259 RepID=UPI0024A74359|nr:IS66 family insertion sequence element accessory protein TnpB [Sphingobacterium thalpophilum]